MSKAKDQENNTINDKTINDKTRQLEGMQDKTRLKKSPPPKNKARASRSRFLWLYKWGRRGGSREDKRPTRQKTKKTKDLQDKRPTRQKTNKTKDQQDKRPTRQ
jgi:hypothetical protein